MLLEVLVLVVEVVGEMTVIIRLVLAGQRDARRRVSEERSVLGAREAMGMYLCRFLRPDENEKATFPSASDFVCGALRLQLMEQDAADGGTADGSNIESG